MARALRFGAKEFRDMEKPTDVFMICAVFSHFANDWIRLLSGEQWSKVLTRFRRGDLDEEMLEKATLQKSTLDAKEFRFLCPFGVELLEAAEHNGKSEAELSSEQAAAAVNTENAQMEESKLVLARDQRRFKTHLEELERFQCANAIQRATFLEKETKRNGEVMEAFLGKRFPLRELDGCKFLLPYSSACTKDWADETDTPIQEMYTVWWMNLLVPGSRALQGASQSLGLVASSIAANPERTCVIIFAPNVSSYGSTYSAAAIEKNVRELETMLRDDDHRMLVKKITFALDESSMAAQSTRPFWHTGFLLLSDNHTKDKPESFVSHFRHSKLFIRGGVSGLECLQVKSYGNPIAKIQKATSDPCKDLSKSVRSKQEMSGSNLAMKVLQKLWEGMGTTSATKACIIDTFPFCGSVTEAVLTMPSAGGDAAKMPTLMTVSPVWAQLDADRGANERVTKYLWRVSRNVLLDLLRQKLFTVPGWANWGWDPGADEPPPHLPASSLKTTCATASGALAIRQDWLDAQLAKMRSPGSEARKALLRMVKDHNEIFNKTGQNYKDGQGVKRVLDVPPVEGIVLPHDPDAPQTKDELIARGKPADVDYVSVKAQKQEFLYGNDGSLWIHGLEGDVVLATIPIGQVYGRFTVGQEAKDALEKPGAVRWAMDSADSKVHAIVAEPKHDGPAAYTDELGPVCNFLKHLFNAGVHKPDFEMHQASMSFAGDVFTATIKPTQTVCLLVQPVPAGTKEDFHNVGSRLLLFHADNGAWKWLETPQQSANGLLELHPHVQYEDGKAYKGIVPVKPGVYLAKAIQAERGQLRRLV